MTKILQKYIINLASYSYKIRGTGAIMGIKLVNPILKGRLLIHSTDKINSPIVLPFGSVLSINNWDFYATQNKGEIVGLKGKSKIDRTEIDILPAYSKTETIESKKYGKIGLAIWEVMDDSDRYRAYNIIMRSHYMSTPLRGLILAIKFLEPEIQKSIINSPITDRKDKWSPAWNEEVGSMVGCLVLDQLTYSNPKGRRNIAEDMKCNDLLEGPWYKQKRNVVIDRLNVAWVSRIAIDAPYRNLGLGTILADQVTKVARIKRIPSAKYVEVFTTYSKEKANEIIADPNKAFLTKANFLLFNEVLPSKELLQPNEHGNRVILEPAKKLYFYRKTDVSL